MNRYTIIITTRYIPRSRRVKVTFSGMSLKFFIPYNDALGIDQAHLDAAQRALALAGVRDQWDITGVVDHGDGGFLFLV